MNIIPAFTQFSGSGKRRNQFRNRNIPTTGCGVQQAEFNRTTGCIAKAASFPILSGRFGRFGQLKLRADLYDVFDRFQMVLNKETEIGSCKLVKNRFR